MPGTTPAAILIVEDEAIVARDIQQTLAEQGYDPFAIAASAAEALSHSWQRCPDLVLMDIRIKGPDDGIVLAAALRERFAAPIVYLTAHADDATLERAKSTEPYGYLIKPVKPAELKSTIEMALYKHRAERRLRERERFAALGTMAAGVAHELNNPLAVVVANAELVAHELERQRTDQKSGALSQTDDGQRLDDTIDAQSDLRSAATRIARVISDIQSFSQAPPRSLQRANVKRAVERALRSTRAEIRPRARLVKRLSRVPDVKLDEERLVEVLLNLLSNAAQAIPPGHPRDNQISIATRDDPAGQVVIEVCDSGCGMSLEVQERIFEPFFTTKAVGAGKGLGLSVCHGIVTAAGGRLGVQSRVNQGSTFTALLPALDEDAPSSVVDRASRWLRGKSTTSAPLSSVARIRILAIDDEPVLLRSIRRLLVEHDVTCVESARSALQLLEDGARYDLILSDVMMPGMTGIDFYEELARTRPEDARKVVFVTGGTLNSKVSSFLWSVPNSHLAKPFGAEDVRRIIRNLSERDGRTEAAPGSAP
jgi:signal transduction histidine kinase